MYHTSFDLQDSPSLTQTAVDSGHNHPGKRWEELLQPGQSVLAGCPRCLPAHESLLPPNIARYKGSRVQPHFHTCHPHHLPLPDHLRVIESPPHPCLALCQHTKGISSAESHLERYGLANRPLLVPSCHLHTLCPSHISEGQSCLRVPSAWWKGCERRTTSYQLHKSA